MDLKQLKIQLNKDSELIFQKLGMNIEIFGDNIYSTCPVHEHSDNPRAFSYSKKRGIWKCWTRDCQSEFRNDIFGLITGALSLHKNQPVDFKETLKWIYNTLNIEYDSTAINKEETKEENQFYDIINLFNEQCVDFIPKKINNNYHIEYPSKYLSLIHI